MPRARPTPKYREASMPELKEDRSRALFSDARKLIPGGVNSPVRACANVGAEPFFVASGSGDRLTDVDGNEYIDYVLSYGPMLLGHADPDVTAAIAAAAARGTSYGAPCPDEVALAEEIHAAMPGLEMVRMVNSGTEAAMSALRLARAATKRKKVLKFIGCYHGHADAFLAAAGSGVATLAIPGTPGVPEEVVAHTLLCPYNDLEAATRIFSEHGGDIACAIVEPVAANMGLVPPLPDFLPGLERLCREYRSLLVFDEVITGFRLSYGGAQGRFGIDPDLTCLGKIIGGGLPVGAFGGKRKYMELMAPDGPVYQAGTLSGNPLAMAAGLATLRKLKSMDYGALERRTSDFAHALGEALARDGMKVQVPTIASMFCVFFSDTPVADFSQARKANQAAFASFYRQMRGMGVNLAPSGFETGFTSFAHSEGDLRRTLEAAAGVRL